MKSRELVLRTLEFSKPERIPRQLWVLPWAQNNYPNELKAIQEQFPPDIINAPGFYRQPPVTKGDAFEIGTYVDEWGCVFENKQAGIIGEVKEPLVTDLSEIDKVTPPTACLSIDIDKVNEYCGDTDKFVLAGCCPRPFERLQFLRGTENTMMDLALESPEVIDLINIIHKFHLSELELWARTDVDGMIFMDDWGAQRSLLISPDLWRKIFKPLYSEYIETAHNSGKKAFMHSDGYIVDILEDLIEIGLDAVNSQIFCMGVPGLGEKFRGRLTFWGEIDRQHLLPEGSKQDIIEAVNEVKSHLYADGGVIAQMEFGPGAKPENVMTAFETWDKFL